ncbi:MAG TPA: MFS transporter [Chloroflexota bacterium]|nr:MFS transporter [Chloroflexota bacterium]
MARALLRSVSAADERIGQRRRILISLVGCHTVNDFYTLVIPIMLPAIRASFGLSYSAVAIVPFLTQATSAVLQPTLGYLADRRTLRRLMMVLGFLAFACAMIGLGQSRSFLAVLVAAICLGIAGSTYHPQSATLLAYFFEKKGRGFAQGIHGMGNAAGFVLGPVVGGFLLARLDWHQAATWLALPACAAAVAALLLLAEPPGRGGQGLLAGITRPLVLLTLVNGLALATSSTFTNWLPSYYVSHGYTLAGSALLTALMSVAAFLAQPLGGALSDRLGRRNLLVYAPAGTCASLVVFLLVPSIGWAIGLSVVVGFWSSLMPPVTMVYASELAAGERTGTAVGIVWGLGTTMSALALPASGWIIDAAGGQIAPAYAALAALAGLAAILALRLPRA